MQGTTSLYHIKSIKSNIIVKNGLAEHENLHKIDKFHWKADYAADVLLNDRVFAKTKIYDVYRRRIFHGSIVS